MNIIDMQMKIKIITNQIFPLMSLQQIGRRTPSHAGTNARRSFFSDKRVVNVCDDLRTITLRFNRTYAGCALCAETEERMVEKMPDIEIPKCVVSEPSVELNIIKTPLLN